MRRKEEIILSFFGIKKEYSFARTRIENLQLVAVPAVHLNNHYFILYVP
jgi:hypothetical protein